MAFYQSVTLVLGTLIGTLSWSEIVTDSNKELLRTESQLNNGVMEKLQSIKDGKHSDFGIKNNCINTSRIRSLNFVDDQMAYLDVGRGRQVVLYLSDKCPGIKARGFFQKTRANRLCARFDSFEVIDTGMRCRIQSLEPHITLEADD
jgi:hypothetical protein